MLLSPPLKYPTLDWAVSVGLPSTATVSSNTTFVNKILPAAVAFTGEYVRLSVKGPATGSLTISNCWIGYPATSGNAYNFDGNQVRLQFAASNSITVTNSDFFATDLTAFVVDDKKPLLIAFDITSGSSYPFRANAGLNFISYSKGSSAEAGTTSKATGYTAVSGKAVLSAVLQVNV